MPGLQRSDDRAAGNVERGVQAGGAARHDDRGRGGALPPRPHARAARGVRQRLLITKLPAIRNRIRELRRQTAARSLAESSTRQAFANAKVEIEGLAAQLGKGQALDLRWTIIGLFISAALRGSVTGRDPQAPSTLWIVIIRQHRRNSMLHSASCLELVLLVTLRWYVIPSALGNHHTNQTRRNDRHNRHRRGPAAPTPSRPPRTLTQPEVGAQPIRSNRQARVGEAVRMPGRRAAASSTRRASGTSGRTLTGCHGTSSAPLPKPRKPMA